MLCQEKWASAVHSRPSFIRRRLNPQLAVQTAAGYPKVQEARVNRGPKPLEKIQRGKMQIQITDETRRVGREIKKFLAVNRISREQFCFETKLGGSTVDKLISGRYSEATLQIVLERTKFVRSNSFAAEHLGEYSRAAWTGYLRDYLFLQPSLFGNGNLEASRVSIEWDENVPGLVLIHRDGKASTTIGCLSIPHERHSLIYIQPIKGPGRWLIVSTMVGETVMRGLMLTVNNFVANAYVPIAVPIAMHRLAEGEQIAPEQLGTITLDHPKFASYRGDLQKVLDRQFGRLIGSEWSGVLERTKNASVKKRKRPPYPTKPSPR